MLVTTIEVWEPGDVAPWWAALRDPDVDLVARALARPARRRPRGRRRGGPCPDGGEPAPRRPARARRARTRRDARRAAVGVAGRGGFATDEVGGPSAGLMLALGVVARLASVDPTARPDGAGVGPSAAERRRDRCARADGRVVGVGGVEHKLRSVVATRAVVRSRRVPLPGRGPAGRASHGAVGATCCSSRCATSPTRSPRSTCSRRAANPQGAVRWPPREERAR
jgi:hypothetical protein